MKILLDEKEVKSLGPESLPMLIHGEDHSGASLYTITLATKWFAQGYKILCLCGYPMAEEAFYKLTDHKGNDAEFYTAERTLDFIERAKEISSDTILIIKNIELFDKQILNILADNKNIIISGDLQKSILKDEIAKINFATKIFFSAFDNTSLPTLSKYEGFVISDDYKGITKLEE